MSETVTYKGKLVPMTLEGVTLEERAEYACQEFGFEMKDYYDSWVECLEEEGNYRAAYIRDGIIYEVKNREVDPPNDFIEGTKNEDGSYDYFVSYYNGGAGFSEIMEQMIKEADKESSK